MHKVKLMWQKLEQEQAFLEQMHSRGQIGTGELQTKYEDIQGWYQEMKASLEVDEVQRRIHLQEKMVELVQLRDMGEYQVRGQRMQLEKLQGQLKTAEIRKDLASKELELKGGERRHDFGLEEQEALETRVLYLKLRL
ncbi:hypothetical protein AK830_g9051 [Neonectria ditissima]|uniref:Uncharacterized protein n=1 Tax=Neonectria ditissima TaxID=78410 RepID=A0A0P7BD09_9HYPO|nr:hypothetical protein AK830_g9051 [Neonectria ditissima]